MSGPRLVFDFGPAKAQLATLLGRAEDLSPLMEQIAGVFASATEDAFENQSDPAGEAWAALSPRRIAERTEAGKWPGKILQFNGILAASVQTDFGQLFAEIGSGMIYAGVHQFGYGRIPKRSYLGVGDEHIADITVLVEEYLLTLH